LMKSGSPGSTMRRRQLASQGLARVDTFSPRLARPVLSVACPFVLCFAAVATCRRSVGDASGASRRNHDQPAIMDQDDPGY
jgi:hypothetical protein